MSKPDLAPYSYHSAESTPIREEYRIKSAALYNKIVEGVNSKPIDLGFIQKILKKQPPKGVIEHFNDWDTVATVDTSEVGLIKKAVISVYKDGKPSNRPDTTASFDESGMGILEQKIDTTDRYGLGITYQGKRNVEGTAIDVSFSNLSIAFNNRAKDNTNQKNKARSIDATTDNNFSIQIIYDTDNKLSSVNIIDSNGRATPVTLVTMDNKNSEYLTESGERDAHIGLFEQHRTPVIKLGNLQLHVKLLNVLSKENGEVQRELRFEVHPETKDKNHPDYQPGILPSLALPNNGPGLSTVEKGVLDISGMLNPPERLNKSQQQIKGSGGATTSYGIARG